MDLPTESKRGTKSKSRRIICSSDNSEHFLRQREALLKSKNETITSLPHSRNEPTQQTDRQKTFIKEEKPQADDNTNMLRAEDVKEEFLVCSICTHEYDEESHVPRILPCLHTFCQECLKKLVKSTSIRCPLCKQDFDLPAGGIATLAKDTTRRNLIDFIKVRKRSSEILCKDCPEDLTAVDFCKECYIFMCPECCKAHRRSLASRKHNVLSIKDLQNSGIDVFRRKLVCGKTGHEGQQLAFYCTKPGCETSICTACTVCDHEKAKGHQIINVRDLYKVKKEELDNLFTKLEDDMSSAKFILQQTEQELLNFDIKELEIEKDIDDAFDTCQAILNKRRQHLKDHLAVVCEQKKSNIQSHVETIENYLDSALNAKDFSLHVLTHTDPTEFVPLHTTLLQRLKNMSTHKFDRHVLKIESPQFENTKIEEEFQQYCKHMGDISTTVQQKRLAISRGQTHIGLSSASTIRHAPNDKRIGDVALLIRYNVAIPRDKILQSNEEFCKQNLHLEEKNRRPAFTYDSETVHQYREIGDKQRLLRNYTTVQKRPPVLPGGRRLKKYRGVIANRAFNAPGKFYFEIAISYNIVRPLENINFVFEVGVSRRGDIDHNYYIYDQPNAWSFCGQHCDDHKQVCIWCRHHGLNLAHIPLSHNTPGTTLNRTFGFLLNADRGMFVVLDATRHRKLYTFRDVDFKQGLWPVFGCHWPSKVKLEMLLKTGREIENPPEIIHTS